MSAKGKKSDKKFEDGEDLKELLREFDENPYDPHKMIPEDVMRIFYESNITILPVVSKRNILIGVIFKNDIVSEMSDLDRFRDTKIDKFITNIAKKVNLDALLPHITTDKRFKVINIFGEDQGQWSRLELITACENLKPGFESKKEIEKSQEDQVMEWMIYFILEHIPRPLYAMNVEGKTIFYNSFFEDIVTKKTKKDDVDIDLIEKKLNDTGENEFFFRDKDKEDIYFYNKTLDFYYEKVPMYSKGKKVGFLIYLDRIDGSNAGLQENGQNSFGITLSEKMKNYEKDVIETCLKENNFDISKVSKELGLTKIALQGKLKKFNIKI